ncbi:MAG: ATP-binding protein [Opitutaceae bacterium]
MRTQPITRGFVEPPAAPIALYRIRVNWFAGWVLARLTRRPPWRPWVSAAINVALIGLVAFGDYSVGPHVIIHVFYVLPVVLAAAWLGWRASVVASIVSVGARLATQYVADPQYAARPETWWNSLITLAMFLVLARLLRGFLSLQLQLEERVRQRTAALEEEVAARNRLQRELLRISDRERSSIGHDLHDGLCQHLAGTALAAQVLAEQLATADFVMAEEAHGIVRLVEEGIAQTRTLANGLLLAAIQPDRLAPELEKLAENVRRHHGVPCRLAVRGDPMPADDTTASHLFRIAEEAVRNALRHAHPTRMEIVLAGDRGALTLSVADDGPGLPPRHRGPGMGLRVMAHRAEIIQGGLDLEPAAGGGTLVRCRVPPHGSA